MGPAEMEEEVSDEKILARVRKLLAKAEGTNIEAEAEAYNLKAAELIAEYGIDRALAAADGKSHDKVVGKTVTVHAPYSRDKAHLLGCIARPLRADLVIIGQPGKNTTVRIIGFESDLERIDILFTSLLMQAANGLAVARPEARSYIDYDGNVRRLRSESVQAYRRTWLSGFSSAVAQRLRAAEERAAEVPQQRTSPEGKSTALVLVDRKAQVAAALKAEFPRVRYTQRNLSGTGHTQGFQAGQRANLGAKSVSNRRALT
jgi:Protein of unknown function (DUF2786)